MEKKLCDMGYNIDNVISEFRNRDQLRPAQQPSTSAQHNSQAQRPATKQGGKGVARKRSKGKQVTGSTLPTKKQKGSRVVTGNNLHRAEEEQPLRTSAATDPLTAPNSNSGVDMAWKRKIETLLEKLSNRIPTGDALPGIDGSDAESSEDEDEDGNEAGKFANVYDFTIDSRTLNAVHGDQHVPLYKLLPGFHDPGNVVTVEHGVMKTRDSGKNKLLEK